MCIVCDAFYNKSCRMQIIIVSVCVYAHSFKKIKFSDFYVSIIWQQWAHSSKPSIINDK